MAGKHATKLKYVKAVAEKIKTIVLQPNKTVYVLAFNPQSEFFKNGAKSDDESPYRKLFCDTLHGLQKSGRLIVVFSYTQTCRKLVEDVYNTQFFPAITIKANGAWVEVCESSGFPKDLSRLEFKFLEKPHPPYNVSAFRKLHRQELLLSYANYCSVASFTTSVEVLIDNQLFDYDQSDFDILYGRTKWLMADIDKYAYFEHYITNKKTILLYNYPKWTHKGTALRFVLSDLHSLLNDSLSYKDYWKINYISFIKSYRDLPMATKSLEFDSQEKPFIKLGCDPQEKPFNELEFDSQEKPFNELEFDSQEKPFIKLGCDPQEKPFNRLDEGIEYCGTIIPYGSDLKAQGFLQYLDPEKISFAPESGVLGLMTALRERLESRP